MLHLKITFMLLFANIILTLTVPAMVLSGNLFFDQNEEGQFRVGADVTGVAEDINLEEEGGIDLTSIGIIDGLKQVVAFLGLLLRLLFASLIVAYMLPNIMTLILGVPLFMAYLFAIVGFIRSG